LVAQQIEFVEKLIQNLNVIGYVRNSKYESNIARAIDKVKISQYAAEQG